MRGSGGSEKAAAEEEGEGEGEEVLNAASPSPPAPLLLSDAELLRCRRCPLPPQQRLPLVRLARADAG